MGARFDALEPSRAAKYAGHIILTTRDEAPPGREGVLLYEEYTEWGPTVSLSILLRRCGALGDELVVGVDPGQRLGLSVLYGGQEVERSLATSPAGLVLRVSHILGWPGPARRVVRIGNGDMATAKLIHSMLKSFDLPPFRLELVDEMGTSLRTKHCNQRGKRDMLAARAIAQTEAGLPVAVAR